MNFWSGRILPACNQSEMHESFNLLFVQMKLVNVQRSLMLPRCIGEVEHFKANSFYSSNDTMRAFIMHKKQVAFLQLLLNEYDDDDKYGRRQLLHRNEMHTCYVTTHSSSGLMNSIRCCCGVLQIWRCYIRLTYLLKDHVITRSIPVLCRYVMVS